MSGVKAPGAHDPYVRVFADAKYTIFDNSAVYLRWNEALEVGLTAFSGRDYFATTVHPGPLLCARHCRGRTRPVNRVADPRRSPLTRRQMLSTLRKRNGKPERCARALSALDANMAAVAIDDLARDKEP